MKNLGLGDQELKLWRFIAQSGPLSVGEAAERFGTAQGLARSTILTVMERLRRKRYLVRRREGGVYKYASARPYGDVLKDVVDSFVDTALAGSLSPFVAYLADSPELSRDEAQELERLVLKLESRRKEKPDD
jgi:predicted transcriptional regulator